MQGATAKCSRVNVKPRPNIQTIHTMLYVMNIHTYIHTYICHHSGGVTSTMYRCCFKKRKRDPTKKQRVNHPSPVWASALDPASEKRSWFPTCLLPVLLLLAGSRTISRFPTAIPALEPTLAARSTCATRDATRWFSRWWAGSMVSTPTPKAAVVLFIQSIYKNRLSCGVAPFSYLFPLPLSSCLGCIPPLIGLPFLRFCAVAYSLFLLFV